MTIHLHTGDLPGDFCPRESVAVDTETMGLDMRRDRLCLVQLSDGSGTSHLVSIRPGTEPAPNLERLLTDPEIVKIFHFARFDLAALKVRLGVRTAPVYCTKIASRLCRTYTDRHSLKELCRELLGVEIGKQQQTSDWGAAELTPEQLDYAASDVLWLHRLRERLDVMLAREGRLELARRIFAFLPERATLDLLGFDRPDIFLHQIS